MASATIAPEFFTNVVSTFITKSNVGLGGVLGALLFNVLGVAATGGLGNYYFSISFAWKGIFILGTFQYSRTKASSIRLVANNPRLHFIRIDCFTLNRIHIRWTNLFG